MLQDHVLNLKQIVVRAKELLKAPATVGKGWAVQATVVLFRAVFGQTPVVPRAKGNGRLIASPAAS